MTFPNPYKSQKLFLAFPGQGSQFSGMGKDWASNFSAAKDAYEEASDGSGIDLKKMCFDGAEIDLRQTENTQPSILTTSVAIYRVLKSEGFLEGADLLYAGHSLGEFSALTAMGALSLHDAAALVRKRGAFMQKAVPEGQGMMAALMYKPGTEGLPLARILCDAVQKEHKLYVSVANDNSPEQVVLSGEAGALPALETLVKEPAFGARKLVPLAVSAPFHCKLMQPAADALKEEMQQIKWAPIQASYIPNVEAKIVDASSSDAVKIRLYNQVCGEVRWTESVRAALNAGYAEGLEVGPGKVLSGLAKRISVNTLSFKFQTSSSFEEFKTAFQINK